MLTISPQVFGTFAAADLDAFVARVSTFVKENVPGMANEPDAAMAAQVRRLKDEAATFALKTEQGIVAFIVTAAYLGTDFAERFRGARQILLADESEPRKAELLGAFTATLLEKLEGKR